MILRYAFPPEQDYNQLHEESGQCNWLAGSPTSRFSAWSTRAGWARYATPNNNPRRPKLGGHDSRGSAVPRCFKERSKL